LLLFFRQMLDVFLRERNEQKVQFKHAAAAVQ
jgi:hypothetical protein